MEKLYRTQALKDQSFFQKLFRKLPKENFIIELENLLSENEENISLITESKILELREKYKVEDSDFKTEREEFYDIYLNYCLCDERLTDEEKKVLEHLKKILNITDKYVDKRMKQETELIYRRKIKSVISDSKIDESEKKELDELQKNLNIDESAETKIRSEEIKNKIQPFINEIIKSRRMSPDDEKKLNQMAKDMNVNLSFEDDGLEKLKLFWKIENEELPVISCDINIQKSESLYYKTSIAWYEERTRTVTTNYGGVSTRIRICKGVYLHGGSIAPSRHTEEYMKLIDSGELYITNKRIIFRGTKGNKTINLSKILAYEPFNNGIQIEKDTGKSPFFECDDAELLGMYLSRMLAEL